MSQHTQRPQASLSKWLAIHIFEFLFQYVFMGHISCVSFSRFEVCEVTILTCWPLTPPDISTGSIAWDVGDL